MANIIIIDQDIKTQRQIELYIRELDKTHHIRTFTHGEEFLKKYTEKEIEPEASESDETTEDATSDAKNLPHIDIIIFQSNSVDKKVGAWIRSTIEYLVEYKLNPSTKETQFIALRYEDDGSVWRDLHHPQLLDIFTLPLDRLLVIQKLEILLALPEKISPSFLFSQTTDLPIEISKQTMIEGLSETAIAIKNPVPLKTGVASHIYFSIPEGLPYAGTIFSIYGKTFHNEPHPEFPGMFLVYISFFGISSDLTTKLRAILSRVPRYNFFKESEPEDFKFDPRNIFITDEDKKTKNIVVLDVERQSAVDIANSLQNEIGNLDCFACNSYFRFSEAHFISESDREMGQPSKPTDFPTGEVKFKINSGNWTLASPPDALSATDTILGHNVAEMFAQPEGWKVLFNDLYHASILSESLRAAELETMLDTEIEAQDIDNHSLIIQMSIKKIDETLEILLTPASVEIAKGKFKTPLSQIDMIFINSHLIPTDVEGWLERFTEKIIESRLNTKVPKIVVMADSKESALSPLRCLNLPFFAYIDSPVNPRQVAFTCSIGTNTLFSRYTKDNLNFADLRIPVYLAKNATLEGLSEFGSSITMRRPLSNGALLYLHGSIFENAPEGHLCARFYHSEEHPDNKNLFRCHFLYYGITDAFLKYTRNFIREQYTSGKTEKGPQ